ncbi:MAG: hypothetical protein ACRDSE_09795 [Pseudonocardiaceae bacterium]
MSEWSWVVLGYGITYVAIAVYLLVLARRWARVRRKTGERR